MYYFSSDWHLTKNNKSLIFKNIFNKILPNDTLFFLGDFSDYFDDYIYFIDTFKRSKINFIPVLGNHDDKIKKLFPNIKPKLILRNNKYKFVLSHNTFNFNKSKKDNVVLIHGHNHKSIIVNKCKGKTINVCINLWNFNPVSIQDIELFLSQYQYYKKR